MDHQISINNIIFDIFKRYVEDKTVTHNSVFYIFTHISKDKLYVYNENGEEHWYFFSQHNHRWIKDDIKELFDSVLSGELLKFTNNCVNTNIYDIIINNVSYIRDIIKSKYFFYGFSARNQIPCTNPLPGTYIGPSFRPSTLKDSFFMDVSDPSKEYSNFNISFEGIYPLLFKHFYNSNFQFLKDSRYVLGFQNGVYDLKNSEFRNGKIDDYCSMTTGIYYSLPVPNDLENLNTFMLNFFPNISSINTFFTQISYALFSNILDSSKMYVSPFVALEPIILKYDSMIAMMIIQKLISTALGQYILKFTITNNIYYKIFDDESQVKDVITTLINTKPNSKQLTSTDVKKLLVDKKVAYIKYNSNLKFDYEMMKICREKKIKCFLQIDDNNLNIRKKNLDASTRQEFNNVQSITISLRKDISLDLLVEKNERKMTSNKTNIVVFPSSPVISSQIESQIRYFAPIFLYHVLSMKNKLMHE